MRSGILALKDSGEKKVKIQADIFCLELCIMRNGYNWASIGVDRETLTMIKDTIIEYLEKE
jgi:hypothetical protein